PDQSEIRAQGRTESAPRSRKPRDHRLIDSDSIGYPLSEGRLTTHVLDTAAGRAAAGMRVVLWRLENGETQVIEGRTKADGRCDGPLLEGASFASGPYRLDFHVGDFSRPRGVALVEPAFLDIVPVRFGIAERAHYHVPLLVAPYGYSTYRGS